MLGYVHKEKFIKPAANAEESLCMKGKGLSFKTRGKMEEEVNLGGCCDKSGKAYRAMLLRCGFNPTLAVVTH